MKITFHGAARTVTGSQHLVEVNGVKILLDCGLYQGKRSEAYDRNRKLPFDPAKIDVMILSHAHTDHAGNIPSLVKQGYKGDVICTHATRDLCAAMLLDSGRIQQRDVEFANKRRIKRGEPPFNPLYTEQDARKSLRNFTSIDYYRPFKVAPGVTLTYYEAGHMLGSAIVQLEIEDSGSIKKLVFSGDVGRKGIPIIRDPDVIDGADQLILESTYGNRVHETFADAEKELERIVNQTYQRGGSIVIPAFAVGRTQQLVYSLNRLSNNGDIPTLPIYVDSPLAVEITAAFRTHPECYDEDTELLMESDSDPFGFQGLVYTRSLEDSKRLNFLREPSVIISASGMAEHGRVLHHLRHRIGDARNTVLITGFQAENTLGRRLVEGEKLIKIFGEEYEVNAQVAVINGFSGHADCIELSAWVGGMKHKPKRTFLVHGEVPAMAALRERLASEHGLKVEIPDLHQSFEGWN